MKLFYPLLLQTLGKLYKYGVHITKTSSLVVAKAEPSSPFCLTPFQCISLCSLYERSLYQSLPSWVQN